MKVSFKFLFIGIFILMPLACYGLTFDDPKSYQWKGFPNQGLDMTMEFTTSSVPSGLLISFTHFEAKHVPGAHFNPVEINDKLEFNIQVSARKQCEGCKAFFTGIINTKMRLINGHFVGLDETIQGIIPSHIVEKADELGISLSASNRLMFLFPQAINTVAPAYNPRDVLYSSLGDNGNYRKYRKTFSQKKIEDIVSSVENKKNDNIAERWLSSLRSMSRMIPKSVDERSTLKVLESLLNAVAAENNMSMEDMRIFNDARNINQKQIVKFDELNGTCWESLPEHESAFHALGYDPKTIIKYVAEPVDDEGEDKIECAWEYDAPTELEYVYDSGQQEYVFQLREGKKVFVNDGVNTGTYNYSFDTGAHFVLDMVPWILWGTGAEDTLSRQQRLRAAQAEFKPYVAAEIKSIASDLATKSIETVDKAVTGVGEKIKSTVDFTLDNLDGSKQVSGALLNRTVPAGNAAVQQEACAQLYTSLPSASPKPACPYTYESHFLSECTVLPKSGKTKREIKIYNEPIKHNSEFRIFKSNVAFSAIARKRILAPCPLRVKETKNYYGDTSRGTLKPGDIIFLIDQIGEGQSKYWFDGELVQSNDSICSPARFRSLDCWAEPLMSCPRDDYNKLINVEEWLKVIKNNGEQGWIDITDRGAIQWEEGC